MKQNNMTIRFNVNKEKHIVVAYAYSPISNKYIHAKAKCSPDDVWRENFGKHLSAIRLNIKINKQKERWLNKSFNIISQGIKNKRMVYEHKLEKIDHWGCHYKPIKAKKEPSGINIFYKNNELSTRPEVSE